MNLLKAADEAARYAARAVHQLIDSRAREGPRFYESWWSVIAHWVVHACPLCTARGCVAPPHPPTHPPTGNHTATRARNMSHVPPWLPVEVASWTEGAIAGQCCIRTAAGVRSCMYPSRVTVSTRRMRHSQSTVLEMIIAGRSTVARCMVARVTAVKQRAPSSPIQLCELDGADGSVGAVV